jgi:hypothetical protein
MPQCSFHGLTSSIHMYPILLKRQHKTAILCDMSAAFYVKIRQVLRCAGVLKAAFHTVDSMNQVEVVYFVFKISLSRFSIYGEYILEFS